MNRSMLVAACLSMTACSTSTSQVTRAQQYDDTAQTVALATVIGDGGGDVGSMFDSVTIAFGALPRGFSLQGNGQVIGNRFGVTYSYTITCENAAGTVLALCDTTTDRASVVVAWSGSLESPNLDAAVDRHGSWTITGLQRDTAIFGGESSFTLDTTVRSIFRPGVTTTYMFDATASYDAIAIATHERQVIGGTVRFDVTARHEVTGAGGNDSEGSFGVHAAITFHADHTATLVLDGDQRYSIDLATGGVGRVS